MKIAIHMTREEIAEAAQDHEVEFLFGDKEYDYFAIDGMWVRTEAKFQFIPGVEY